MYDSMTLVKTSKILHCKYIGLCYALGRAITNSKRVWTVPMQTMFIECQRHVVDVH